MNSTSLAGRSILVVEDEPLILLDIVDAFERAGAQVTATGKLADAAQFVEANGLSAAILDHGRQGELAHADLWHGDSACRAGVILTGGQ